ncbi:FdtA/QdtA family cupin domain-containing protein [Pedobacter aquatilis]|uniref:sugar 3,4-ketoisomerase n=1 Tax=Pedobacter aquatilis TaxID=351343 RepID=UPI002931C89E|nr:FdtA/QdtA family cupin domain-containing protein [Pedobacter aquatilis]
MSLELVQLLEFPKIIDERGNLSFLEEGAHLPFLIKRTYWIYDVPGGEERGGHSYFENEELIIALSGSFDVIVSDGISRRIFSLNRSYYGLYVPAGIWRQMGNFSTNSLAFIAASTAYNESDYERDLNNFKKKNE